MSEVTSPILLDSTGQTTNTKLDNINTTLGQIKNVLTTPSDAEDISYDNTSSGMTADNVQEAVDELNASLVNFITKANVTKVHGNATRNGGSVTVPFPSGFDGTNCIVICTFLYVNGVSYMYGSSAVVFNGTDITLFNNGGADGIVFAYLMKVS